MVHSTDPMPHAHELWSHLLNPVRRFGERVAEFFSPIAEAAATTETYEIALELPGLSDEDIHLEAHGDRLVVAGEKRAERAESGKNYYLSERAYGRFRRTFRVPDDGDLDKVGAELKEGCRPSPFRSAPRNHPKGRGFLSAAAEVRRMKPETVGDPRPGCWNARSTPPVRAGVAARPQPRLLPASRLRSRWKRQGLRRRCPALSGAQDGWQAPTRSCRRRNTLSGAGRGSRFRACRRPVSCAASCRAGPPTVCREPTSITAKEKSLAILRMPATSPKGKVRTIPPTSRFRVDRMPRLGDLSVATVILREGKRSVAVDRSNCREDVQ